MARTNYGTLSQLNTMADCRLCGKRTHSSNSGIVDIDLCPVCIELTETENSCSDNCWDAERNTHRDPRACPDHGAAYTRLLALQETQKAAAGAQAVARAERAAAANVGRAAKKLEKLAKWDALPRCAWCLCYNGAHKKSDRCGFCRDDARPSRMAQDERERMLRERAWMVKEIAALGGTAPACPFPTAIEEVA